MGRWLVVDSLWFCCVTGKLHVQPRLHLSSAEGRTGKGLRQNSSSSQSATPRMLLTNRAIYYLRRGKEVMFYGVCLSVCLFVCPLHYSKSYERILMNFWWVGAWFKKLSTGFWWLTGSWSGLRIQQFLKGFYRASAVAASPVLATVGMSVRPSVRPSVRHTLTLCENDAS